MKVKELRLFSNSNKKAIRKIHEETTPKVSDSKRCPNCNAGWFNGRRCFDCNSDFQLVNKKDVYDLIYNAIPTGKLTAWECIKAFKALLKDVENLPLQ